MAGAHPSPDAAGTWDTDRWLAYTAHHDGLAIFQKNDPADARIDTRTSDGMIIEECNRYHDPCPGPLGDGRPYLSRGEPVLNAEYVQDGETTKRFRAADVAAGISGALFNIDLPSARDYMPCAPAAGAYHLSPHARAGGDW